LMHSWAICSQVRRITFVRASRWPGLSAGPAGRCGRRRPEQFGERRGLLLIGQHRCPCLPSAHRGDPRRRHTGGVRIWRTCHSRTCLRIQPRPCGACGRLPGSAREDDRGTCRARTGYAGAKNRRDDHPDRDQLAGPRRPATDAGLPGRLGAGQFPGPRGVAGDDHGVAVRPAYRHGDDLIARL